MLCLVFHTRTQLTSYLITRCKDVTLLYLLHDKILIKKAMIKLEIEILEA